MLSLYEVQIFIILINTKCQYESLYYYYTEIRYRIREIGAKKFPPIPKNRAGTKFTKLSSEVNCCFHKKLSKNIIVDSFNDEGRHINKKETSETTELSELKL